MLLSIITYDITDTCIPLLTGDVGYCNKDGHLVVTDRLKELIKYKGMQVHSTLYIYILTARVAQWLRRRTHKQ